MIQPALRRLIPGLILGGAMLLSFLSAQAADKNLQAIPELTGPVIDLTDTITAEQQQSLSQKLISLHARYGAQMQVLIIPTTAPEDAFTYSMRVVDQWKLGDAKKDDGLLLFIAKNDHRSQLQVGYGLEGVIPDVIASRLLNDVMAPYFKQGDFAGGINAVIDAAYQRISGETPAETTKPSTIHSNQVSNNIVVLLVAAFILLQVLKMIMGRLLSATIGGTLIFLIAWLFLGVPVLMAFMAVVFLLIFSLLNTGSARGYPSGYGGGGFGGGGGWSGGGGGFGGGGSSGRW